MLRRGCSVWLVVASLGALVATAGAEEGEGVLDRIAGGHPVLGADIGVAVPVDDFRTGGYAETGAAWSPFFGWRIGGAQWAITPLVRPQVAVFSEGGLEDGTPSITSFSAGARASAAEGNLELFLESTGGIYWSTDGPTDGDDGGGFTLSGGLTYEFFRGGAFGLFGRWNKAAIQPALGSDEKLQFVVGGLEFRYRFGAEEAPPPAPGYR